MTTEQQSLSAPAGETDLGKMLAGLTVSRRPGTYTYVDSEDLALADVQAMVREAEGPSFVVEVEVARRLDLPINFEAAWLSLGIHSSLEAVGLTAAISAALTRARIPCNVLAGQRHDHLLVPTDRAEETIAILSNLG